MKSISQASKTITRASMPCLNNILLIMKGFDLDNEQHKKLEQVDIHSAGLRRSSLPQRSRPQSLKAVESRQPQSTRPLYQETYYVSNLRDNYLTLISDNMQILELPLGLIHENVKIGCPIRLKLEYDYKRQQADEQRFKSIQKQLYEECRERGSSDNRQ